MRNNTVRRIVTGGMIAALYAVLTVVLSPISYGPVQVRVSEALTVLPFFMPEAVWGVGIGCFIANLYTGNLFDVVLGTLATLLAACATCRIGKKHKRHFELKKAWYAPLPAVVSNGLITGAVLKYLYVDAVGGMTYPAVAASVALGELAACYIVGVPLMYAMNKYISHRDA